MGVNDLRLFPAYQGAETAEGEKIFHGPDLLPQSGDPFQLASLVDEMSPHVPFPFLRPACSDQGFDSMLLQSPGQVDDTLCRPAQVQAGNHSQDLNRFRSIYATASS